jgi:hypothetical protein
LSFALGSTSMELPCTTPKKWKKTNGKKMGGEKRLHARGPVSLRCSHVSLSWPELLISVNIPFRTLLVISRSLQTKDCRAESFMVSFHQPREALLRFFSLRWIVVLHSTCICSLHQEHGWAMTGDIVGWAERKAWGRTILGANILQLTTRLSN